MQQQKRNYTKHIFDMEDVRYIDSLKDVHKNQDIWVIGAGSSMNYVDPSFFDNKITVGLNHVGVYVGDNEILHHMQGRLSCKQDYTGWFRKCTGRVVRYANLPS